MKENSLSDLGQAIPRKKFRAKIILPLVLFMAFCSLTQASYAQETRLNLKLENSTLLDALKKDVYKRQGEFWLLSRKD